MEAPLIFIGAKIMIDMGLLYAFMSKKHKTMVKIVHPWFTFAAQSVYILYQLIQYFLSHPRLLGGHVRCDLVNWIVSFFVQYLAAMYSIKYTHIASRLDRYQRKTRLGIQYLDFIYENITSNQLITVNWENEEYLRKIHRERLFKACLFILVPTFITVAIGYGIQAGYNIEPWESGSINSCLVSRNLSIFVLAGVATMTVIPGIVSLKEALNLRRRVIIEAIPIILAATLSVIEGIHHWFTSTDLFYPEIWPIIGTLHTILLLIPAYIPPKAPKLNVVLTFQEFLSSRKSAAVKLCVQTNNANYVDYLLELEELDLQKPLQMQKFAKKYFRPESPYYLEMDYLVTGQVDLHHPDPFIFHQAKQYILDYLQLYVMPYYYVTLDFSKSFGSS